jgi:predicted 3-demethylubiquinone-9 3-methyltransferase (glyoxalase superfamily)
VTGPTMDIAPCLWLDDQAEAAAQLYCGIFPGSRVTAISRYPTTFENPGGKPRGSVLTVEIDLAGSPFTLLNGGRQFHVSPSISFFVHTRSAEETRRIASALADSGSFLMDLAEYPWSPLYAWVRDRYDVSWQVMLTTDAWSGPTIMPCLMFSGAVHGRAEEALRLYAAVFPDGAVEALERYGAGEGPEGTLKHGRASLGDGRLIAAMDSHLDHDNRFDEAISLQVYCADQVELDHYWDRLSEGGEEGPCGWLKDRFGVSWQVVPRDLIEMTTSDKDGGQAYERAFRAMLDMGKLDIGALRAAFEGRRGNLPDALVNGSPAAP